ncbi:acylglycerol kinase family protein [bacterium]|nr:acylglycerol kinase family protein [bacterium]
MDLRIAPELDIGRPIRTGVINNPLSFRNRRRHVLPALLDVLRDHPWVAHHEVHQPEEIVAATQTLLGDGCELIVVNGGDGTVQAVLTGLFSHRPVDGLPLLAVLPGGTTNMVAADIGAMSRPVATLQRVLATARAGCLRGDAVQRPVMRVEITPETPPIYSMFFGTGAIYHGIRFCRQYVATLGLRGEIGPGVALAVFLSKIALGHGGSMFPPLHLSGRLDGRPLATGAYIGALVSTVSRQFLGLRPFWGEESAPLKYTAMSYAPQHLWRAAPAVMRGRPNRFVSPENGYTSHNAHELELHLDCGFTLDGELHTPRPGTAVRLRSGYHASFLRPRDP